MTLLLPTAKLNELDHLILFRLIVVRNNKLVINDLKDFLPKYYEQHNLKFPSYKLTIPSENYVYQRLRNMVLLGYLERFSTYIYRINRTHFNKIKSYILTYMEINYEV